MTVDYFLLIGAEAVPAEFAEFQRCDIAAFEAFDAFALDRLCEADVLAAKLAANAAEIKARDAFLSYLRAKGTK